MGKTEPDTAPIGMASVLIKPNEIKTFNVIDISFIGHMDVIHIENPFSLMLKPLIVGAVLMSSTKGCNSHCKPGGVLEASLVGSML